MTKRGVAAITRPIGLVTAPNRVSGMPVGSLYEARGVYLRDPGVLVAQGKSANVPGYYNSSDAATVVVGYDCEYPSSTVNNYQWTLRSSLLGYDNVWTWAYKDELGGGFLYGLILYVPDDTSGNVPERLWIGPAYPSQYRWFAGRTFNGERLILPTGYSVSVQDRKYLSNAGYDAFRIAGLPIPKASNTFVLSGTAGAIKPLSRALYVAVIRRTYNDGVELVSAPSAAYCVTNSNPTDTLALSIFWHIPRNAQDGDYLDVYRTRQQPCDYTSMPIDATELGEEFLLAASLKITAAYIGGDLELKDNSIDDALGKALYTNTGVRGGAAANAMPPPCNAVETFKSYTFYGNITELPSHTVRVGGFWGPMGSQQNPTVATAPEVKASGVGLRYAYGNVITLTSIQVPFTEDLAGLVVGQILLRLEGVGAPTVPFFAKIIAINLGSHVVTIDKNFSASSFSGATAVFTDVVEVDGVDVLAGDFSQLGQLKPYATNAKIGDWVGASCLGTRLQDLLGGGFRPPPVAPSEGLTVIHEFQWNNLDAKGPLRLRATNGQNYIPQLPAATATPLEVFPKQKTNYLRWSEQNNAEACPLANIAPCGSGVIYTMKATRDALYIFASDGLWRLSGSGGSAGAGFDWRIDPVDPGLILTNSTCVCAVNENVYALTNRGFVRIDSSGNVAELSRETIADLFTSIPWDPMSRAWVTADNVNREVVFMPQPAADDTSGIDRVFVYNVDTGAFTELNTESPTNSYYGAFDSVRFNGVVFVREDSPCYIPKDARHAGSSVVFQPNYGGSTFAITQFASADLIFDSEDDGLACYLVANPRAVGDYRWAGPYIYAHKHEGGIARASGGISRQAPSVGSSIMLGYVVPDNTPGSHRFHGLGIHLSQTTDRRILRQ